MKTHTAFFHFPFAGGLWLFALMSCLSGPSHAATVVSASNNIVVPNGSFNNPGTVVKKTPVLILSPTYNDTPSGQGVSNGWVLKGSAVAGVLTAPAYSFGGGQVAFSGLLSTNVAGLVSNGATVTESNIGATYKLDYVYTLSVDFSSTSPLNLSLLSQSGFGIRLLDNGSVLAQTPGALTPMDVTLLSGSSGTINLSWTATSAQAGHNIGIELFVGNPNGLIRAFYKKL